MFSLCYQYNIDPISFESQWNPLKIVHISWLMAGWQSESQNSPQEARKFGALRMLEHPTDLARIPLCVHSVVNWHTVIVFPFVFKYFLTTSHL